MHIDNHFGNYSFLCIMLSCRIFPGVWSFWKLKFVWTVFFPHEGISALSSFRIYAPKFDFKAFILRKWKHFMSLIHLRLYKINIWFIFLENSFILFFHSLSSVIVPSYTGEEKMTHLWHCHSLCQFMPSQRTKGQLVSVTLKRLVEFRWAAIL